MFARMKLPRGQTATLKAETIGSGRIPSLDGWRGIAILLVLIDHLEGYLTNHYRWPWADTGQHGVTIFFVLSGFLITSKLIENPADLGKFYTRRFFRLMPAAWAYLAVLLFLSLMTKVSFITLPELRQCLLFYRNYGEFNLSVCAHFWSLSLEEQFYLVWPAILLLSGIRRSRWIAAGGAIACAIYRWIFWAHYNQRGPNFQTQVRADALLIGCLTALLLSDHHFVPYARRWSKALSLPALATLVYCVVRFHRLPTLAENIAIAVLITACVVNPTWVVARTISFRPLAWLGVVSYSIYVWQELFMHLGTGIGTTHLVSIFVVMPVFAVASYYGLERPCIRLGHRLTKMPSRQTLPRDTHGASAPSFSSMLHEPAPSPENR
jgi:peptidoglycan/LPS O-acetylase OafA/YrhL